MKQTVNNYTQSNADEIKKIMSDMELRELARFADNALMVGAVKKVLLYGLYYSGTLKAGEVADPLRNFAFKIDELPGMTNELIGQLLRAKNEGIATVEIGFREIENFKSLSPAAKKSSVNEAR